MLTTIRSTTAAPAIALMLASCVTSSVGPASTFAELQFEAAAGCEDLRSEAPASTFVLYLPASRQLLACNPARAKERFLPASTYKVPHALIALETGAVTGPDEVFAWDGQTRRVAAWNRSATLGEGLRSSTVWIYKEVARRIGWKQEETWVRRLRYGNQKIGGREDLTTFWLDGKLRISAHEQVEFLDRLRRGALAASPSSQAAVTNMMMIEQASDTSSDALFAKSGAVLQIDPVTGDISDAPEVVARLHDKERVGWYVGWVDGPGAADGVFALNLRLEGPRDLAKRERLARALLAANRNARNAVRP